MREITDITIEPMKIIRIDPIAFYRCPYCVRPINVAFYYDDPEWFVCPVCHRSVVPYADG